MTSTLLDNSAFHTSSAPDVICNIYPKLVFSEMGLHDLVKKYHPMVMFLENGVICSCNCNVMNRQIANSVHVLLLSK